MSSLEKCLSQAYAHFLIGLSVFLLLSCMGSLHILQTFVRGVIGKYVLPYSGFPFHFDGGFFSCAEGF